MTKETIEWARARMPLSQVVAARAELDEDSKSSRPRPRGGRHPGQRFGARGQGRWVARVRAFVALGGTKRVFTPGKAGGDGPRGGAASELLPKEVEKDAAQARDDGRRSAARSKGIAGYSTRGRRAKEGGDRRCRRGPGDRVLRPITLRRARPSPNVHSTRTVPRSRSSCSGSASAGLASRRSEARTPAEPEVARVL